MALRWLTAGESHGPGLTAILDGMPSGLHLDAAAVDAELARRQGGYGRGGRMKIESDRAEFTAGVRHGSTLGSPIAIHIPNLDHANWRDVMAPFGVPPEPPKRVVTAPRPGHADLAGGAKHGFTDLRDVLERASARETAARVAIGAVARQLLAVFGVRIASHVQSIGAVTSAVRVPEDVAYEEIAPRAAQNDLACLDARAYAAMVEAIGAARAAGDTLGGVVEVCATGLPPGLGSHVHWDRKLDGRIGQAMLSIPAVKGVEIGPAFDNARLPGSQVHDPIERDAAGGLRRSRNRAGGLEGGITNGAALVLRVAMKPLSTLMKPLPTIDLRTGAPARAAVERSDVCAVPACGVVAEAMLGLVLADAWTDKFGADSLAAMQAAHAHYCQEVARWSGSS
jgi:chorismate synthase